LLSFVTWGTWGAVPCRTVYLRVEEFATWESNVSRTFRKSVRFVKGFWTSKVPCAKTPR